MKTYSVSLASHCCFRSNVLNVATKLQRGHPITNDNSVDLVSSVTSVIHSDIQISQTLTLCFNLKVVVVLKYK